MVIGASATYGDAMKQNLTEQGAKWIECAERPFSVQRYVLDVPTQEWDRWGGGVIAII